MFRLIFIILITAAAAQAQQITVEQIAFNHFATEVFAQNYPNAKRVFYYGQTEREETIGGPFAECFKSDSDFQELLYQKHKMVTEKIDIESEGFPQFKVSSKSKPKQLNLRIYRAVKRNEIVYVYMKVYREMHFVDHYLIKISVATQKVLDVCHTNEII